MSLRAVCTLLNPRCTPWHIVAMENEGGAKFATTCKQAIVARCEKQRIWHLSAVGGFGRCKTQKSSDDSALI